MTPHVHNAYILMYAMCITHMRACVYIEGRGESVGKEQEAQVVEVAPYTTQDTLYQRIVYMLVVRDIGKEAARYAHTCMYYIQVCVCISSLFVSEEDRYPHTCTYVAHTVHVCVYRARSL